VAEIKMWKLLNYFLFPTFPISRRLEITQQKMRNFYKFMALGFGAGRLPLAPGTWGAALALLLIYPLVHWAIFTPSVFTLFLSILIILFTWIGVKACDVLEDEWGEDPKQVVIDEMIGVWIALLGFQTTGGNDIFIFVAAFILFRFFDIAKPLGIKQLENIKGGWGVMLDDVLAGVYANIVLQILIASSFF
jgi:phosphatidylglycerophosphatase A